MRKIGKCEGRRFGQWCEVVGDRHSWSTSTLCPYSTGSTTVPEPLMGRSVVIQCPVSQSKIFSESPPSHTNLGQLDSQLNCINYHINQAGAMTIKQDEEPQFFHRN